MINKNRMKMKTSKLVVAIGLTGLILLALSNIVGIGYFLYLWGGTGVAFGLAAWVTFKVWVSMILSGILLYGISFFVLER